MYVALPPSASTWSDEQRAAYYARMAAWQKDEVVGLLLALFLGSFGAHQFYLHRTGLGILYCVFFWTGIPAIVGLVECFFMPDRVRRYNLGLAAYCAASIGAPMRTFTSSRSCPRCGAMLPDGARFCGQCGARVE